MCYKKGHNALNCKEKVQRLTPQAPDSGPTWMQSQGFTEFGGLQNSLLVFRYHPERGQSSCLGEQNSPQSGELRYKMDMVDIKSAATFGFNKGFSSEVICLNKISAGYLCGNHIEPTVFNFH